MKKLVLSLIMQLLLLSYCSASPLQDFTKGKTALDAEWQLNLMVKDTAVSSTSNYGFGLTHGLGNKVALKYRQSFYDTYYGVPYSTNTRELDVLYKANDFLQFFAGYATAAINEKPTNLNFKKNVAQAGVIGTYHYTDKVTLYTILGGGRNYTNVEFGASYALNPNVELNATYRHLTIEKVSAGQIKSNFRGFGIGLTYKF